MRSLFLYLGLVFTGPFLFGQSDILDLLKEPETKSKTYTTATFKGTRIVNGQSNETPGKGVLQFMILHRFGAFSDDFFYNFFGLDNANVRIGLDYGINDRLNIGFGRSTLLKTYDGFVKYRLLKQEENGFPFGLTAYAASFIETQKWNDNLPHNESERFSYAFQWIFTKKFNESVSLALTPSWVHFNVVDLRRQDNTIFTLGLSGRYKLTKRVSINAEYFPQINRNFREENGEDIPYENALSLGFDIETGGHVFQLFFSNSRAVADPHFMARTTGKWLEGDVFFGFNISRVFTLVKPKMPEATW